MVVSKANEIVKQKAYGECEHKLAKLVRHLCKYTVQKRVKKRKKCIIVNLLFDSKIENEKMLLQEMLVHKDIKVKSI